MHSGKTLWITLISLCLCAQASGADPRKRKAVVDTQKAVLCLEERCYPEYESIKAICKRTGRSYQDVTRQVLRELAENKED